ncbi:MAG: glycoside hydrolase family 32 protein [Anaerolineales bacterium]|nr:glycoside hydrolase family 32 protein [Anaerolineales bacterium]
MSTTHLASTADDAARAAQEAQLRADPALARFAESRRRLAADPHRPIYHFVSPESMMNDPNGLCRWRGQWHLFYQAFPEGWPNGRIYWGHAVSDDLIHWRDLPYAIAPGPEKHCFSGATLVEDDRVIAMYHGVGAGNMVAVASDPLLLNWEKVTGQAVIPIQSPDGPPLPYAVFDPCIWKKDGLYYALSGGTLPHGPSGRRTRADFLFRSANLETWEYLHPFVEEDIFGMAGDDGACPYFWPIGDRHILLHFSHHSGGKYVLGDYDTARDKLVATHGGRFTFGPWHPGGVHAPSATPDGQGGVIVIFNMNQAKPSPGWLTISPDQPVAEWNQIMSLPRRLMLVGKDELAVEPTGDIESLRGAHQRVDALTLPANQEIVLEGVQGNAMEIVAEIDPQQAPMVEMNVLRSPGKEETTRIVFYRQRGYQNWERMTGWGMDAFASTLDSFITIDSSYSSELPHVLSRAPETAPVYLAPDETLKLRVFIDRSVIEVFVNGRQCVAQRVYPGRADSIGVSLRAQGGEAVLCSLDAWQMKSIYDGEV